MEVVRTQAENGFIDIANSAQLEGPEWFAKMQQQARDEFVSLGLPHRRVEEWKYTDLKSKLKSAFPLAQEEVELSSEAINEALGQALGALAAHRLVIVDGQFHDQLSDQTLVDDIEVLSLKDALKTNPNWIEGLGKVSDQARDAIQALNLATVQGGIAIKVSEKTELAKPLHVIVVNTSQTPSSVATRLYFDIGAAAKVEIIESHITLNNDIETQANIVTELTIGNWAEVSHVKFTTDEPTAVHLANVMAKLGKETDYKFFQFTLDGGITRNQVYVRYDGAEAKADISGVALLSGKSHADLTLVMDHAAVGCESRELFKTVLNDTARAVFQGKVIVQPGAQKTDGEMMSKALLLSEQAEFDSKPELEIYADDVLCGHGATTGQIDDELLFYLKARGIEDAQARALLIQAFVGEALELVENSTMREVMIEQVVQWYARR